MSASAVPGPVLNFVTQTLSTHITVRCSGRVVSGTCDALKSAVGHLIATTNHVVLDFAGVSYLDSSGLGSVVGLYASAKSNNCQLKVVNLTPRVREFFSLTRLLEVLESHSNKDFVGDTGM